MKKSIELLREDFQSSSSVTPQFVTFFNTFKKELTKLLKSKGCTEIVIDRGHFYAAGFFTTPNKGIYYFSISDVRWFKEERIMYRTAKHYKDFTGGLNQYVALDEIDELEIFE